MPGPGLAGPGHRRRLRAGDNSSVIWDAWNALTAVRKGSAKSVARTGATGPAGFVAITLRHTLELSPPHPAIAPTSSAKTPRPILLPSAGVRGRLPFALVGRSAADTRTNATRDHDAGTPIVSSSTTSPPRVTANEIAMSIWTTCAGIVQTLIANPSKRGASVAIFSWTRQGVRHGVSWRIPQLVGECVAKFGITWRVAAQLRAV